MKHYHSKLKNRRVDELTDRVSSTQGEYRQKLESDHV